VERSNATLDDLRPDLRAHYLAALADSYVAAGGQNPEITLARVGQMEDPTVALADAIRFYQANPSAASAVSEINLRTLAAALGEEEAVIQSLQEEGAVEPGQGIRIDEPGMGWLTWLTVTFTALLLLVGGLWIAYQLLRRRYEETEGSTDSSQFSADEQGDTYVDSAHQASEADRIAKWRAMMGEGDLPDADEPPPTHVRVTVLPPPLAQSDPDSPVVFETEVRVDAGEPAFHDSLSDEDDLDEDEWVEDEEESDEDVEDEEDRSAEVNPRVAEYPTSTEETKVPHRDLPPPATPSIDAQQPEQKARPAEASSPPPLPGPATMESLRRKPNPPAVNKPTRPPAENAGNRSNLQDKLSTLWRKDSAERQDDVVDRFTATYQYGIADYDESFIITANNELMGACGMGIDKELDPKAASSDKVQVLDVWFYDRTHLHTYNQLIVSRSVNWDKLTGKANNSGTVTGDPLVAAPGVTFKLVGKDLILDCRIESVEYMEEDDNHAPFRSVVVLMTVRKKK
jgi:hypothetical protein